MVINFSFIINKLKKLINYLKIIILKKLINNFVKLIKTFFL